MLPSALSPQIAYSQEVNVQMQSAISWFQRNKDYGVLNLHINVFDPLEPWDPPQSYNDLNNPGYSGEQVIYPTYAPPGYYKWRGTKPYACLVRSRSNCSNSICQTQDGWAGSYLVFANKK